LYQISVEIEQKILWPGGSSLLAATITASIFRPEPIDNGRRGNKFTW
jgi:hypothetical protein